jgi:hypothetical protein
MNILQQPDQDKCMTKLAGAQRTWENPIHATYIHTHTGRSCGYKSTQILAWTYTSLYVSQLELQVKTWHTAPFTWTKVATNDSLHPLHERKAATNEPSLAKQLAGTHMRIKYTLPSLRPRATRETTPSLCSLLSWRAKTRLPSKTHNCRQGPRNIHKIYMKSPEALGKQPPLCEASQQMSCMGGRTHITTWQEATTAKLRVSCGGWPPCSESEAESLWQQSHTHTRICDTYTNMCKTTCPHTYAEQNTYIHTNVYTNKHACRHI